MARKHASNAGFLLPEVSSQAPPPPPRDLPFNIATLLLPGVIREVARGKHIDDARRSAAFDVFKQWIDKLNAGSLNGFSETQVEGDFTGHLFKALGYRTQADITGREPFSMLPKWTTPVGGIADVALGLFHIDESNSVVSSPRVVVELKGTAIDLDRRVGGRTPVEQAWVYLNACESADWAIVSNFAEIRLYHRKGSNYVHRVRLIDLADPDRFAEFYAVFHADALLGTGNFQPTTAWMLEQTEHKQETVGEALYEEYKVRRQDLIREFTARGHDFAASINAAQKLLDRILFVAFAEDRGLLDSTGRVLEHTANLRCFRRSKWNNFQSLFEAIDQGDPPLEIPQYNGELFKPDPILDDPGLQLDDKWPAVFAGFGIYDFKHEVTEAVLGRIFELSIEDIEKLRKEGLPESDEPDPADQKKTSRRKLQGVFYTNASIVDYLVNAALQPAYDSEKARLAKLHNTNPDEPSAPFLKAMTAWLDSLSVCDPACGSGAFLSRAYNWFETRRIELLNDLHALEPDDPLCAGHPDDWRARSAQSILSNNLYGVDLSGESVEIARLSLWIRTARRDHKLTNLADNVVQGNSVVSDANVDPLAFDWQNRFPRVFQNGGFDAVIGNPPYVRQEFLGPIKEHLQANYQTYHGMADLYVYFYERGLDLLKPGGRLAFVVTNKWMKAGYGEPLRRHFADKSWVESVVDFGHAKQFFKDIDVFPCFLVVRKPNDRPSPPQSRVCMIPRHPFSLSELETLVPERMISVERSRFTEGPWQLESDEVTRLLARLRGAGLPLSILSKGDLFRGVLTGLNDAFLMDTESKERLVREDPRAGELLKPYLRGQDIKRWSPGWNGLWMIRIESSGNRTWPWSSAEDAEAVFAATYPSVYKHLLEFKPQLISRQDQGQFWWELRACAYWEEFEKPKIIFPEITWHLQWCLDTTGALLNNTAYILSTVDRWVLAVMNSPAAWWYAWRSAVHGKDEALRYIKEFVQEFPIPNPSKKSRQMADKLVGRLVQIAATNQSSVSDLLDWLHVEFDIAKPTTKLQNAAGLDSDGFVREVKKSWGKSKALTNAQLKALRDEYVRAVEPARALADEARALELQVHDLVNEAYGLTPDDVRLMWDTAPPRMPVPRPPGV